MRRSHILVVEDNPDHAFLIERALAALGSGIEVNVVGSGEEALRYVRNEGPYSRAPRPNLILLDLRLPKKSGLEVLAELKNDERHKATPVILLTSSDSEADIARSYNLGANSYIVKPEFSMPLVDRVKAIVEYWLNVSDLPPETPVEHRKRGP